MLSNGNSQTASAQLEVCSDPTVGIQDARRDRSHSSSSIQPGPRHSQTLAIGIKGGSSRRPQYELRATGLLNKAGVRFGCGCVHQAEIKVKALIHAANVLQLVRYTFTASWRGTHKKTEGECEGETASGRTIPTTCNSQRCRSIERGAPGFGD